MPDTDEVIAEFSGIGNLPTNAAELFAFGQALSYCMLYLNPFNANFRMDSELVKQWLKGEKRIKSHVVLPIYNRVFPLYEAALGNGGKFHPVRIMHVKGHSGNEMNERADALAGEANANRDGEYLEDFLVDAENRFMRRLEFKSMQDLLVEFSQTAAVLDSLSAQTNNILGFDHDVSVDLRHATDAFTRVFQAVSSEDVE
jgi:ribonuclease HI